MQRNKKWNIPETCTSQNSGNQSKHYDQLSMPGIMLYQQIAIRVHQTRKKLSRYRTKAIKYNYLAKQETDVLKRYAMHSVADGYRFEIEHLKSICSYSDLL